MRVSGGIRLGTHSKTFKKVGHSVNGHHSSHQSHDFTVRKTKRVVISEERRAGEMAH